MQLENFFWWFYHFLGPKNGISLQEHDFLNFLHFWNRLAQPIIGAGKMISETCLFFINIYFLNDTLFIKSKVSKPSMQSETFLRPWKLSGNYRIWAQTTVSLEWIVNKILRRYVCGRKVTFHLLYHQVKVHLS